jgi:hypothetical protein
MHAPEISNHKSIGGAGALPQGAVGGGFPSRAALSRSLHRCLQASYCRRTILKDVQHGNEDPSETELSRTHRNHFMREKAQFASAPRRLR